MDQLRNKLLSIQKEEILREFMGEEYLSSSQEEKDRIYEYIGSRVEQEVDVMLREFIYNYNKSSPQAKQNFWMQIIFTFINIVLTIGIAFAVNEKAWVFVSILGIVSFVTHFIPHIQSRNGG